MTKAVLRPVAASDLSQLILHYRRAGGDELGDRFFGAVEVALRAIERAPGIGSPVIGEVCEVPGLRSWPVKRFPARLYYFITEDHLDVVRMLSDAQDLLSILGEE